MSCAWLAWDLPLLQRAGCGGVPGRDAGRHVMCKAGLEVAWQCLFSSAQVVVGYLDAILGGSAPVATIHGAAVLPIPPGTQAGQRLTLPGAGISPGAAALAGREEQGTLRLGAGPAQRGDHHFSVVVTLPVQARAPEAGTLPAVRPSPGNPSSAGEVPR